MRARILDEANRKWLTVVAASLVRPHEAARHGEPVPEVA
jgi:hypothetical protein